MSKPTRSNYARKRDYNRRAPATELDRLTPVTLDGLDGTRLEILEADDHDPGRVFVTVARREDDEDDERVALVNLVELRRVLRCVPEVSSPSPGPVTMAPEEGRTGEAVDSRREVYATMHAKLRAALGDAKEDADAVDWEAEAKNLERQLDRCRARKHDLAGRYDALDRAVNGALMSIAAELDAGAAQCRGQAYADGLHFCRTLLRAAQGAAKGDA